MTFFERLRAVFQAEEPRTTGMVQNLEQDNDPRNLTFDGLSPLGGTIPSSGDVEKGDWSLNQGHTASCTCHSTVYAVNQATGRQLSPRYAYSRIKTDPKYPSSRLGWGAFMIDSLKLMISEGICEYSILPNTRTDSDASYILKDELISDSAKHSADRLKGGAFVYVTTGAKDNLQRFDDVVRYMAETGQAVKVGVEWRGSFNNARKTGLVPAAVPSGSSSGHDMLAVAWRRIMNHEYLGFRNSFGETWGDKGRIWLPKGFFKISSAIAYLPPDSGVIVPEPVEVPRNSYREKANAQELQAMIDLKFPLNVDAKNAGLNKNAIMLKERMWLLLVQAVSYRGWTFIDVVNYLYARSRNKTGTKAYDLDFTKQK